MYTLLLRRGQNKSSIQTSIYLYWLRFAFIVSGQCMSMPRRKIILKKKCTINGFLVSLVYKELTLFPMYDQLYFRHRNKRDIKLIVTFRISNPKVHRKQKKWWLLSAGTCIMCVEIVINVIKNTRIEKAKSDGAFIVGPETHHTSKYVTVLKRINWISWVFL